MRHISHRTVVLYRGQIMESGDAEAVADHPQHPYSKALVSAAPLPDPDVQRVRARERSETSLLNGREGDPLTSCAFASRCTYATNICWEHRPPLIADASGRSVACVRTGAASAPG